VPVAPTPPPQSRGRPLIAWILIVLAVVGLIVLPLLHPLEQSGQAEDRTGLAIFTLQARVLVGAAALLKENASDVYKQTAGLDTGPLDERFRFAVLAGELAGPEAALNELQKDWDALHRSGIEPTSTHLKVHADLETLYDDYVEGRWDAPSLSEHQREQLQEQLGWFGRLALAPANGPNAAERDAVLWPAIRTVIVLGLGGAVVGLLAVAGFFGLIVLLALLLTRYLRNGVATGSSHGAVYAETFALWLLVFIAFQLVIGKYADPRYRLLLVGIAELVSLLVLAWPMLRGVSWHQVRAEIGWTSGRNPPLEPFLGIAGWSIALPMVAVSLVFMVVVMHLLTGTHSSGVTDSFEPTNMPSHPIVQLLIGSNLWMKIQVVLLASVVAPIVEETMFRGVLYRHLREATARWGFAASVLASALMGSLIFAVIHPQGPIAIPALMSLAIAFTLIREWRGTLLPGMVAHAINNGLITIFLIVALSG
jgi:membrane protease YdiL (CAAX protease family)